MGGGGRLRHEARDCLQPALITRPRHRVHANVQADESGFEPRIVNEVDQIPCRGRQEVDRARRRCGERPQRDPPGARERWNDHRRRAEIPAPCLARLTPRCRRRFFSVVAPNRTITELWYRCDIRSPHGGSADCGGASEPAPSMLPRDIDVHDASPPSVRRAIRARCAASVRAANSGPDCGAHGLRSTRSTPLPKH